MSVVGLTSKVEYDPTLGLAERSEVRDQSIQEICFTLTWIEIIAFSLQRQVQMSELQPLSATDYAQKVE